MRPASVRFDVFALGLAAVIGALLAALAILQCGLATAAGADRIASSPQLDPTGSRVIAALGDPMVTGLGSISLAVAVVGYVGLGAFVTRRGGSSGFAARLAALSFAMASVVSLIVEQVLYTTATYYFATASTVAYYVVNLGYVIAVLLAAVAGALAAGGAAVARRLTSRRTSVPAGGRAR